ncbi:E3 ubiquitin/ISG15 ligase TRIM25-like [Mixophyes fleayi]|uniref:E3 ubiquitin/ISG15 ligase TRIM25-like n=1 Tax=Mixophyes fleayi TaxID=3061075 RepID=UPI003F4E04B7
MASSDMREELSCSICLCVYTDPVALTCGHNYCRVCIGKVLDSQRQHGHYSCPECREVFPKRPQLKKNMKLHNILEHFRHVRAQPEDTGVFCTYCIQSSVPAVKTCVLCEASLCDNHLRVHSKSVEHVLTEPTSTIGNRKCPAHKKVLEYYCFQDKACVCVYCTLGNEHRGHRMVPLNEASGVKKETLDNILKTLTSKNERVCDQIRQLESARTELARKMRHVDSLYLSPGLASNGENRGRRLRIQL